MRTDSLARWVDELQGQIDDLKRNTGGGTDPSYTRQLLVDGEEITGDPTTTIEVTIPSTAKYLYIKLFTEVGLTPSKQIRYAGIFDASDLGGYICPSFVLVFNDNVAQSYNFRISYNSGTLTVRYEVATPEGYVPGTVKMDLISFNETTPAARRENVVTRTIKKITNKKTGGKKK